MQKVLIVGAGFSGAVVARELADLAGISSLVIDARDHVAGNCHTFRASDSGVMEHVFGPHIFHTDRQQTWDYVNRFAPFQRFVNRVKASTARGVFSFPINLHTINQFFGTRMNPAEAKAFVQSQAQQSSTPPTNFEQQALALIGPDLYETFIKHYTQKQWGCHPTELPASILQRLPIRFDYNDAYHLDPLVGIPENGYTALIANLLDHPLIDVHLSTPWTPGIERAFDHLFFTGSIDAYFGHCEGRLGYRTVYWDRQVADGDFQGNAVINYPGAEVPHTRVHEHKHFAPWESHSRTVVFTEFSKETQPADTPFYPKRLAADLATLSRYHQLAQQQPHVTFLGRLATYRYLDMNRVIEEARAAVQPFLLAS
jgi:UDP-galactopyranose mutase